MKTCSQLFMVRGTVCVCVCVSVCVCVCVCLCQWLQLTCMGTTCEKMASGTASRMDSSQMETALRHVQKTALDVWMSIGFTMALYLTETEEEETTLTLLHVTGRNFRL